ncbi:prepilin peptidase [Pseudonocardia broussonetiae]|uniref:Prepilin peptidase n=1 Tax=Pseudonocardia broussonetiae TaxID=2736640 RepID=A0A6M6JID8_9PSEU|nr:A24 family peptidase [Pseudonocardia broussonetiae]QJY47788.1 prepilin peptidase [Pseudonocardia broussonetiae]
MAAILVSASCAVGAAALTPLLVRLADATAHRNAVTTAPVRFALAVALGGVGAAAGARLETGHAVGLLPVLVLAGAAALVDAHERRLPDVLTGCLAAGVAVTITLAAVGGHADGRRALYGFVAGLLLAIIGKWLSDAAVGWGDVKLAPSLTACLAWSGWFTVYVGLLAWALFILATAALLAVRSGRVVIVPYGPSMVTGTLIAVLVTA